MSLAECEIPAEKALEFLFEPRKISEEIQYKSFKMAVVLTYFDEKFKYFNAAELNGAFVLDSSCDDLVESLRREKEITTRSNGKDTSKDARSDKRKKETIFILLMSIYAEVQYIVQRANGWDFSKDYRVEAEILVNYSLFRDENKTICEKIIALTNLLGEPLVESERDFLLRLAYSKLEQAFDFWDIPVIQRTNYDVFDEYELEQERKFKQTKISNLFKKNQIIIKKEQAKENAESARIEAKKKSRLKVKLKEAKINAALVAQMT